MSPITLPGQHEGETLEEAVKRILEKGPLDQIPPPPLSADAEEALYAFAFGFYESGNYEKAMHFFRFLTLINTNSRKCWMGLGASYQMLKQHERALQCYGQAALLDETDPFAHWHAAQCFLAINNEKLAKEALNSTELTAKRNPDKYGSLLQKLELMKTPSQKLEKKKNSTLKNKKSKV